MMPASSVVKTTARTVLKGNYVKSVIAVSILMLAYLINLYVSQLVLLVSNSIAATMFFGILNLLVFFPLVLGVFRFFRRLQWGADDNAIEVFSYFSELKLYKRALKLIFMMSLKSIAIGVPLYIPAAIIGAFGDAKVYELFGLNVPVWSSNLSVVATLLQTIASVVLIIALLRYYLAPFLFVADEDMEPAEAMHMSAVISKRSAIDFFFLAFSMIGWIIACVFMLPTVLILPYIIMAYLVHGRFAVAQYNKVVDAFNNKAVPTYHAEL